VLIVSDHASAHVPADIALGVAPEVFSQHVAIDIGVAQVGAAGTGAGDRCVSGGVSRLVCDFNRDADALRSFPKPAMAMRSPATASMRLAARPGWRAFSIPITLRSKPFWPRTSPR
jgi:predicted N-formylglutamate amidohydrolase